MKAYAVLFLCIGLACVSTARADGLEDARKADAAAEAELRNTLSGPAPVQPAMVPDDERPAAPAAEPTTPTDEATTAPDRLGVGARTTRDECTRAQAFWYGRACHVCPVGKLAHGEACDCPTGFLDNGARLSCRCPAGSTVVYSRSGPRCRAGGSLAAEGRDAPRRDSKTSVVGTQRGSSFATGVQ